MSKRWLPLVSVIGVFFYMAFSILPLGTTPPTANAQSDLAARVAELEAQVADLTARIAALEDAINPQPAPASPSNPPAQSAAPAGPTASSNANLRTGPGTDYDIAGSVRQGQQLTIEGCNQACDWYLLESGEWIAAFLVENAPTDVPRVDAPEPQSASEPAESSASAPIASSSLSESTASAPACNCSGNLYNCSDFSTHADAQACFAYCQSAGAGDIHRLDSDSDGIACESLP